MNYQHQLQARNIREGFMDEVALDLGLNCLNMLRRVEDHLFQARGKCKDLLLYAHCVKVVVVNMGSVHQYSLLFSPYCKNSFKVRWGHRLI